MLLARLLIVLLLLTGSLTAQNYTIELERVIPGAENYSRIEPAFSNSGLLSWLVAIDGSIDRYVANDIVVDTSFIFPTTGPPKDLVNVLQAGEGICSVYLAYHQGSSLTVGKIFDNSGDLEYRTVSVPFLGEILSYLYYPDHLYIKPAFEDGQFKSIAVGTVYIKGGIFEHGIEEYYDCWWAELSRDLTSVIKQEPYFHLHFGNMMGDSAREAITIKDNYYSYPVYTEMGWWENKSDASSQMDVRNDQFGAFASIVTDDGNYSQVLVDDFCRLDSYDEIIYEGNAIPLDNIGNKQRHVGCFSLANGALTRVWLRTDIAGLSHYYEPENLLVLYNGAGTVTLAYAEEGVIADSYDLGRPLTATRFYTNPITNTLGLVGRVADTIFVYNFGSPTPVEEEVTTLPSSFTLGQNYPNPFNPTTTINFYLDKPGDASLEVFNIVGQKVTTLTDRYFSTGQHQVVWGGTDSNGNEVAIGIYLYRLTAGEKTETRKMIMLK